MARLLDSIEASMDNKLWLDELRFGLNEYITYNPVGVGSPEGVVTSPLGAVYRNESGGVSTSIYVKETETVSGTDDNTGWVAK